MVSTLKAKLITFFLIFALLGVFNSFLSISYINQRDEILDISNQIVDIFTKQLKDFKIISDFFYYDTKNSDFFEHKKSIYINNHIELNSAIKNRINSLLENQLLSKYKLNSSLTNIKNSNITYDSIFQELVDIIIEKGYKDFGCEGQMRNAIHLLEKYPQINQVKLLTIRRHEKDYIIRNEDKYIINLLNEARQLKIEIINSKEFDDNTKDGILLNLSNYTFYFQKIVELDKKSGLKNNSALRLQFEGEELKIQNNFADATQQTILVKQELLKDLRIKYLTNIFLSIIGSISVSIIFAVRVTKPISILANQMTEFVQSDFTTFTEIKIKTTDKELSNLVKNYNILKNEMFYYITKFQQKVDERTSEINDKKKQLEQKSEEILLQNETLVKQNQFIEEQKIIVTQQNQNILDSIRYAKKIQDALLPDNAFIKSIFPESLIIYQPKDILSGDFYWVKNFKNNDRNISIIAVADCTGHGVPGALLSMLGIAFLNEVAARKEVMHASQLLNGLRSNILKVFQRSNGENYVNDGLDIAVAVVFHDLYTVEFSGANRPFYCFKSGVFNSIMGNRFPIGKHYFDSTCFTNHKIEFAKSDTFYLFTDGFSDQFGEETNKKFTNKNLKALLYEIQDKPFEVQQTILTECFYLWKGQNKQTDDVLLFGVKL